MEERVKGNEDKLLLQNLDHKLPAPVLSNENWTGEIEPDSKRSLQPKHSTQEENYLTKFLQSILEQDKEYPPPVPVLSLQRNGETIPLLTLKSFSLWQGKQKSKKTTVLAIAISAFIAQQSFQNSIKFTTELDGTVLFFDNEQGESYAARTMKLILKLAGLSSSQRLIYCDLRGALPN